MAAFLRLFMRINITALSKIRQKYFYKMAVNVMNEIVEGTPYWTSQSKIPNQYPYLSEDISCDAVIVGGGITGALCAYSLQKAGIDTVLLDASLIGYGSTSVSSSILQYDIDYDLKDLKDLIGLEKAARAYRACVRGLDEIENITKELSANVGFRRCDSFYYTTDKYGIDEMKREFLLRKHQEFPVEFLDNIKAADRFHFCVEAGIYTTATAGEIDPYRFAQALVNEAVNKGLRVFENTSVETVTPDLNGVTLMTSTRHTVSAKKMVNATGLSAAKKIGHITGKKVTFCVVTVPVTDFTGWYNQCIIRDNGNPYIYMRTLPDNRILIGGLDSYIKNSICSIGKLLHIPQSMTDKYEQLTQRLVTMMPEIKNITPEYRFAAQVGDTGDGLPYIGAMPGCPNVYYDICCGSNGIVFAQLGADIIRDLFLGGDCTDSDLFAFNRL